MSRECNSLSYDAMTAHTAVVFTRYMMLSLESRESNDNRSLGELFLYFSDEMSDITWIQAFQMLLQMFRTMLSDNTELSDEKIVEIIRENFDLRPAGIIKMLDLRRPIYRQTAAYGHFGRVDLNLPWEQLDKVDLLKKYL